MNRRDFITLAVAELASVAGAMPLHAQQQGKIPKVGYMVTSSLEVPEGRRSAEAFSEGLREHGYIDGQNIRIEYGVANGAIERFQSVAEELIRHSVDILVAPNTAAAQRAQKASTTIPIISSVMGDPVADGLVTSLSKPGGNITGLTFLGPELVPKRIQLLKQALPGTSRVSILWHPGAFGERTTRDMLGEAETAARTVGMNLQFVAAKEPEELDQAFSEMTGNALVVFPSPMLFNYRRQIVELTAKHRLASMFVAREYVELGGLISYGASIYDLVRRSAGFVDKILKGAKPSDLPVEQATKFELVINMKTAKTLGLEIPPVFLARADEVIE